MDALACASILAGTDSNTGQTTTMIRMATVDQALALISEHGGANLTPTVTLPLVEAEGRRLVSPVIAAIFQPPADVSAMDGYAVRFADMTEGARLAIIGESRAGRPFAGPVGQHQAVRIFTGAHRPPGADHILIQEDARREGGTVEVACRQPAPASIRRQGRDFGAGDTLVPAGSVITPGAIALAAAGNVASVSVRAAPRIGVLANGDELAAAGSVLTTGQVVNSIGPALLVLLRHWGADLVDLGVARDEQADVRARITAPCDAIVSIGGASVGDYDVARDAFAAEGYAPVFEKVAVKPGKPTWFSARPGALVLGLPGNPAAAMVTARLFLKPLIEAMTGAPRNSAPTVRAHCLTALPPAGNREEYLRGVLTIGEDGLARIRPAEDQDSSLLSPFLTANALIRRPAGSSAVEAGSLVEVMLLEQAGAGGLEPAVSRTGRI